MFPALSIFATLFLYLNLSFGLHSKTCLLTPLGHGKDDTDQVLHAIEQCGHGGQVIFAAGNYNITRKMTWDLQSSTVDLRGYLNFNPDINFWLQNENTYRVIFIQDQASWFVITGQDFTVDAHGTGGIQGNGQPWWEYFTNHTREDGDGRPVSLTLSNVTRGTISNFKIISPPFWCNAVANSEEVTYDGMTCNATNENPAFFNQNIVPNTDGIDTYRSNKVTLLNWDVTSGDDCLAIKGNSTNIIARNVTCRGGNGIAFGSLGQYEQFTDIVENVLLEDVRTERLPSNIQPNMGTSVYFKSWDGSVNGVPPTGGGGGGGKVNNVVARNVFNDRVSLPVHIYQTNGAQSGDLPSKLLFSNLTFVNFTGTALSGTLVEIECSPAAPCPQINFFEFNVQPPLGDTPTFVCSNVLSEEGLPGPCSSTT